MVKGERGLFHITQRDIAQQKLGVGVRVAFEHTMLPGDAVGEIGVSGGEHPPGDDLTLMPPCRGPQRVTRVGLENRDRGVGHIPLPLPAHFRVEEPGIRAQRSRNVGDEHAGGRDLQVKRQSRFGQSPVVRRHSYQQAPSRLGLLIPQQAVEPPFVVLRADCGGMLGEKAFLVERVEIGVDPSPAQCRRSAGEIARVQQNFGRADLSSGGKRRIPL